MRDYLVSFLLDGRRTEEIVRAISGADAKRIIQARYSGHKVTIQTALPA